MTRVATILITLFLCGCVAQGQVQETSKSAATEQVAGGDAIAPSPQADQQGVVSFLDQRTQSGIDPLGLMLLLAMVVFLSHRREMLRIKGK